MGARGVEPPRLRVGDVVELRSAAEILATLDEGAATQSMPFMPEMLRHAGQRFTVTRRVEKICDTVGKVSGEPSVSRRMRSTVYLDDLRCDGSAHGGCQAGCRLYWKEQWLKVVDDDEAPVSSASEQAELVTLVEGATTALRESGGVTKEVYRCQATEARAASESLSSLDPRQHVREVTAGNVPAARVVSVLGRHAAASTLATVKTWVSRALRAAHLHTPRTRASSTGTAPLRSSDPAERFQPGDIVRIKPFEEIERTLVNGRHRGLWFDVSEMSPFCGGVFTVKDRVQRFIDDWSGEMIELKTDCLILDGVCCTGEHSTRRWFCPRGIYPFWREDWLDLVEKAPAAR
jgi:hypothetical protein